MRSVLFASAAAAGLLLSQAVQAQDASSNGTTFRGFRAEVQAGGDRYQSQGVHDDKVGFGAAVGWDGVIGEKWVVGPEFTYWRSRGENKTPGVSGGQVAQKSFEELGAAIRAGYLVTPKLLVYGVGGYVNGEQRQAFTGTATEAGYYNHYHASGYQVGGGAEYSLTDHLYTGIGYRYSDYEGHTTRQRVYASAGVRF
jgi:outer membrane immunogenic protein